MALAVFELEPWLSVALVVVGCGVEFWLRFSEHSEALQLFEMVHFKSGLVWEGAVGRVLSSGGLHGCVGVCPGNSVDWLVWWHFACLFVCLLFLPFMRALV